MNIYLASWLIEHGDPDADFDRVAEAEFIGGRFIREHGRSEFERIKATVQTIDGQPVICQSFFASLRCPRYVCSPIHKPVKPRRRAIWQKIRHGKDKAIDPAEKAAVMGYLHDYLKRAKRKSFNHRKVIANLNRLNLLIDGYKWEGPAFTSFLENHFRPSLK